MTAIPTMVITPSSAADAYSRTAGGSTAAGASESFGSAVAQALGQAVQTGRAADDQAMDVVTALSHAEMTLQAATTIRDRVVQAYQDIMKMPI
jgi:flagellar hook-basal body complex protein FliE